MQRRQVNILVQSKLIKLLKSVLTPDNALKADRNVSMGTKLTMTLDFEKPNINMHIPHFVLHSFLKVPMREFVQTSRQFICGDRFIHSHDLYVCSGSVTVWRNRMLVTIGALRVKI